MNTALHSSLAAKSEQISQTSEESKGGGAERILTGQESAIQGRGRKCYSTWNSGTSSLGIPRLPFVIRKIQVAHTLARGQQIQSWHDVRSPGSWQ